MTLPSEAGVYWAHHKCKHHDKVPGSKDAYNVIIRVTGRAPFLEFRVYPIFGPGLAALTQAEGCSLDQIEFGPLVEQPVRPTTLEP